MVLSFSSFFFSSSEVHLQSQLTFSKTFIIYESDIWKRNFQLFTGFHTCLSQVYKIYMIFRYAVKRTVRSPAGGCNFIFMKLYSILLGKQISLYHHVTITHYCRMTAPAKAHGSSQLRAVKIASSSKLNIQKLNEREEKHSNNIVKDASTLNGKDSRRSSSPQVYPRKGDTTCYIVMSQKNTVLLHFKITLSASLAAIY